MVVDDVAAKVATGDIPGGTRRIKDLEVAWDNAEAAIKPASPDNWHAMDSAVDQALTAIRAGKPSQSEVTAALTNLQTVIGTIEQKQ